MKLLQKLNNVNIDLVMNLQGDEPLMDIDDIKNLNDKMKKNQSILELWPQKLKKKVCMRIKILLKCQQKKN